MELEAGNFKGYELVDSGDGRKLEKFGGRLLDRPCPQAIWPVREEAGWNRAIANFQRGEGGTGDWTVNEGVPENWPGEVGDLSFEIRLTGFGNVGLFPEHSCHWDWMSRLIEHRRAATVLNLFAYTGGATMACASAGAKVTHVDSAKSVNGWARANGERTGLDGDAVRYIGDDALKFARRELRRGNKYDGIILDPPTFGRGIKGEVWKIERDFSPLVSVCRELMSDDPLFLLLTSHSPGVTPSVLKTLLGENGPEIEAGEMLLVGGGPPVPAGVFGRWSAAHSVSG